MKDKYNVAVVGATGAVGGEFFRILEEREFPINRLLPLASSESLGKSISWKDSFLPVEELSSDSFEEIDIALFSAGGSISQEFVPHAVRAGAVVIDNTSAFRMEPDVPLVVPEVNPEAIKDYKKRGILSNPNCSTIQMVVVLHALSQKASIKRVVVSTYQSVSGAGIAAMEELSNQTLSLFSQKKIQNKVFLHQIAFNCLPHIDVFVEDDYTKEEKKMMEETKKIMGKNIPVTATCVRVPVFFGHSESVNVEFDSEMTPEEAREILSCAEGVELVDDVDRCAYPLAIHCQGQDPIYVGRIRKDRSVPHGLNLWIVADNIRKGAALNAVQIAELWTKIA